ncbi:MAG: molybdenum cofactor guanylyltransferase [Lachnospiraceae bacterium]|nr:molybdenum cofactor guanylyltransferase [Lachnospiraceae bacterium]
MNISAMILTGGRSVRMGHDKAQLKWKDESLIEHLAHELKGKESHDSPDLYYREDITGSDTSGSDANEAYISGFDADEADISGFDDTGSDISSPVITEVFISAAKNSDDYNTGLHVAADEHDHIGPIEGIRQGLLYAKEEYLFICAVDMPYVKKEMALFLADKISRDHTAYIFKEGTRIHPTCGIYHRSVLPVIDTMISKKQYSLKKLLSQTKTIYFDINDCGFSNKNLTNINTPEEYRTAVKKNKNRD